MIAMTKSSPTSTFDELAEVVAERLALNKRVRRNLPAKGRLRIDRQLPFLCIYRQPPDREDAGTRELVTTEAAYLFASGERSLHEGLGRLCGQIARSLKEHFGTFLFLEIWSEELIGNRAYDAELPGPAFRIVASDPDEMPTVIEKLRKSLAGLRLRGQPAEVDVVPRDQVAPPGLEPLVSCDTARTGCVVLGLAVQPVYREPRTGELYPLVLQRLRRQLAPALRKTFAAFTGSGRKGSRPHYHTFGPTALVRATALVDEQLCEVADAFDFIYQVTPTNSEAAWHQFVQSGYERPPEFWYRPLPYDPNILKRRLFAIPSERIEDTTIAHLFSEKRSELDRQLTALGDIDSPNFLYGSIQLYGKPDGELVELAERLLDRDLGKDGRKREDSADQELVHSSEVAAAARKEIAAYHRRFEGFQATVEVCDDIASGIMVSRDRLLIAESVEIPRARLVALLHHEIGIHLLTYFNGQAQRFQQLHVGLPGYEPLQEGLAVLSEYLSGGLTATRMRQLASRVVAVDSLCEGAEFIETFRRLHNDHGIPPRSAFRTTLRVYRAGGLTKDLVYLKGVRDLLVYLKRNHDLEPLLVGKIALEHVPFVQELRRRGVIRPPAVLPSLLESDEVRHKLERIRGATAADLCGVGT